MNLSITSIFNLSDFVSSTVVLYMSYIRIVVVVI